MDSEALDLAGVLWADGPENAHDNSLQVRFRLHPRQDKEATETAGRPIFKDVEYVSINAPGDRLSGVDRPATRHDKHRFRHQYGAFKDNNAEATSGTPLSKWPLISSAQVEELKHFHIRTVEQLAGMPDGNIPSVGNISHLKKQAGDFLELAKGNAPTVQLRAKIEKQDVEMDALRAQLQEQAAVIARLAAKSEEMADELPAKRGPGRPRKESANADV